jgi:hypothetical protein
MRRARVRRTPFVVRSTFFVQGGLFTNRCPTKNEERAT